MSKPLNKSGNKNCLVRYEKETLRGTRLKREPILIWITPESDASIIILVLLVVANF